MKTVNASIAYLQKQAFYLHNQSVYNAAQGDLSSASDVREPAEGRFQRSCSKFVAQFARNQVLGQQKLNMDSQSTAAVCGGDGGMQMLNMINIMPSKQQQQGMMANPQMMQGMPYICGYGMYAQHQMPSYNEGVFHQPQFVQQ